ncbi:MAG: adenine deaminase [Sphingobacteriaceae bacterium]|nr:adenine deaminase [Sphingobacteriaceae bacterium]
MSRTLVGQLVDLYKREIYPAEISIENGKIIKINRQENTKIYSRYILPGFVDAHIHIESSMLIPVKFAAEAVRFGTISTVSDPHEISNVLGRRGIDFMMDNGRTCPFKFNFGAPSCVPATRFETSGAELNPEDVLELLQHPEIKYLSEMMNYPGVLFKDPEVMQKLEYAKKLGKPIDGHAPGLMSEQAVAYIEAGISTDHECFTLEEAVFKANHGMKILIREGSAARNFDALHPILKSHPAAAMFCSDDKHPDELLLGHIDLVVKRALALGYDLFDVLRAACIHPVEHYKLDVGTLRIGDPADFIVVDDLQNFQVQETCIDGQTVYADGKVHFTSTTPESINHFVEPQISLKDLEVMATASQIKVIEAIDGQIVTGQNTYPAKIADGLAVCDESRDLLKLVVLNRYRAAKPAVAFIRGFGLKNAALAGTVAHDSHNIVAVGSSDELLLEAIQQVINTRGGLSAVHDQKVAVLPLEIAGLMSSRSCEEVASDYLQLDRMIKASGCRLQAPFMTLSFMALLVIPDLKLSDLGLFDGKKFEFTPLFKN